MVRDENWWDASGKDLWRWQQELEEMEQQQNEVSKTSALPEVREQRQPG